MFEEDVVDELCRLEVSPSSCRHLPEEDPSIFLSLLSSPLRRRVGLVLCLCLVIVVDPPPRLLFCLVGDSLLPRRVIEHLLPPFLGDDKWCRPLSLGVSLRLGCL